MLLTNFFDNNFKFFLAEFFLLTAILILTLYGSIFSVSGKYRYPLINLASAQISIFILAVTFILTAINKDVSKVILNGVFICDNFSQTGKLFLLLSVIIYIIISLSYIKNNKANLFEYQLLLLLSIFGLMLLCSSYDLLSIYLALELQSLCLYILAAFNRESAYSTEAGLKYFILGAFSSGLLLFGISIIYGFTGTTNLEDLRLLLCLGLVNNLALKIGVTFLSCAFLFKLSSAPFHVWTPDVYDGAPLNTTIFFATAPKIALILIVIRLYLFSFGTLPDVWQHIFSFSALLSVVIGSFLALKQRKLKRLFAYSSIGHIGYILLGLAASEVEGLHAVIIYLAVYIITSLGIWSLIASLNSSSSLVKISTLTDFSLVNQSNPLFAYSGILLLFSLAGIPPLSGFYAKLCIFIAAVNSSFYTYSFCILIISVVSTYYYLRVIKAISFETNTKRINFFPIPKEIALCLSCSSSLLLFIFVNPNFLWLLSYELSLYLYF